MGQQQEIAKRDDHRRVAPAAQLEELEGHEDDQHGDPGIAPEQGTEFEQHATRGNGDKQRERPAAGEALVAPPQPAGPGKNCGGQNAQPHGLMRDVRHGGRQRRGKKPRCGAAIKSFGRACAHFGKSARASRQ